jgi:protein tyrosine phosphatase (PTP) superfamily phosphohydrolase (DUF442 family)
MASDPTDIRSFLRLSPRITTSGALGAGDPQRLAGIGVRRVVNLSLHSHPEALPDPPAQMAAAGLAYTHIPVPFDAPTEAHYRAFVVAIEADDAPTHVHCIMNWRVSAFFYRWHVEACGMAEPEARALLERIWSPHTRDDAEAAPWRAFVERVG